MGGVRVVVVVVVVVGGDTGSDGEGRGGVKLLTRA